MRSNNQHKLLASHDLKSQDTTTTINMLQNFTLRTIFFVRSLLKSLFTLTIKSCGRNKKMYNFLIDQDHHASIKYNHNMFSFTSTH